MRPSVSILALILVVLLLDRAPAHADGWSFRGGETLPGEPVSFDFERKTLTFRDAISDRDLTVPTRNLSLRSRQKLLFSPLFHRGDGGDSLWPPAKRRLVFFALAVPSMVLFICFWASAWSFTEKLNPILAIIGFLGSWVILGIFAVCYSLLQIRFDGGFKVILVGMIVALAVTPLYLSAVYNCTYGRAHLVFLTHVLAAASVLGFGLASVEMTLGKKNTEDWWDMTVFEPLGLIATGEPPPQKDP